MYEEDAKQEWCPFGYFMETELTKDGEVAACVSVNRWSLAEGGAKCLGSQCMAWIPLLGGNLSEGRCGMVSK